MLLSIITRCYRRPIGLRRNQLSVKLQTCQDYEQILLVDEIGLGINAADARMAAEIPARIRGDYVYVLDDDNILIDNGFIARIADIAAWLVPDIIMVKSDNGALGVLPSSKVWKGQPILGQVDAMNYVVKADVWKRHAAAWATHPKDAGDAMFIVELFRHGYGVHWQNTIVAMTGPIAGRNHGEVGE